MLKSYKIIKSLNFRVTAVRDLKLGNVYIIISGFFSLFRNLSIVNLLDQFR